MSAQVLLLTSQTKERTDRKDGTYLNGLRSLGKIETPISFFEEKIDGVSLYFELIQGHGIIANDFFFPPLM